MALIWSSQAVYLFFSIFSDAAASMDFAVLLELRHEVNFKFVFCLENTSNPAVSVKTLMA